MDENCPMSLKVSFECIHHIQEPYNRKIKKPISKDQEESSPCDQSIDEDLNEVLGITHNFGDRCNDIQVKDLPEFNFRKNSYYSGHHKTEVSHYK